MGGAPAVALACAALALLAAVSAVPHGQMRAYAAARRAVMAHVAAAEAASSNVTRPTVALKAQPLAWMADDLPTNTSEGAMQPHWRTGRVRNASTHVHAAAPTLLHAKSCADALVRQALGGMDDLAFNASFSQTDDPGPTHLPASCESVLAAQDVAYFLVEPCGGFTEQRWAVVQAVAAAYIMHRRSIRLQREHQFWDSPQRTSVSNGTLVTQTQRGRVRDVVLVLPTFLAGPQRRVPLSRVFDVAFLRQFLNSLAKPLTVIESHELPAAVHACVTRARAPLRDRGWSVRDFVHREAPAVQDHVAYNFGCFAGVTGQSPPAAAAANGTVSSTARPDGPATVLWHAIDVHLRLAPELRVLAAAAMRYLRQFDPTLTEKLSAWNESPRGSYVVAHFRSDSAWHGFCASLRTQGAPASCEPTAQQLDRYVRDRMVLKDNEPFYVASLNVTMSELTDFSADTITFLADAVPRLREFRGALPNLLAAIDFVVALHARVFLGNAFSAFSQEIVRLRRAMQLRSGTSVFYNKAK